MQTLDLARTLSKIVEQLDARTILEAVEPFIEVPNAEEFSIDNEKKDEFARLVFDAQHSYRLLKEDATVNSIFDRYGVHAALDETSLSRIVSRIQRSGSRQQVISNVADRRLIEGLYRTMKLLVETTEIVDSFLISPKFGRHPEREILEIELTDYGEHEVSIDRVNEVLVAMKGLGEVIDLILKTDRPLELAFTDSGTKFVFGFTGAGELVDSIKNLFLDLWEALRFMKHDKFERDMDTIVKGLNTKKEIAANLGDGDADRTLAARLNKGIDQRMVEIVGAGAMLKDVDEPFFTSKDNLLEHFKATKFLGPGRAPEGDESPPEELL